ncbi:MAG: SIMPL domain-containing protein [bacterium]
MEPNVDYRYQKAFIITLVIVIAIGNALAGWFVARSVYQWRTSDRYVSVKGIAERQVKADLAVWDISYKITGDDLARITTESLKNQKIITSFLTQHSFALSEIEPQRIEVLDQYAREYTSGKPEHRYIITGGIVLHTPNVDLVRQVSQLNSELIQQGIVLMSKTDYQNLPNPRYFFTKLDEIRPQMLEQTTKSARLVAKQFATNADCQLGYIRRANQGVFQILNINSNAGQNYGTENSQIGDINQVVRVVTSVDYTLKN